MSCNLSKQKLQQMNDFLASGIVQTSVDGTSATYDRGAVSKKMREAILHNPNLACQGYPVRTPFLDVHNTYRG